MSRLHTVLVLVLVACGDPDTSPAEPDAAPPAVDADAPLAVASLELSPPGPLVLAPGESVALAAVARAADGRVLERAIVWRSSDHDVAGVADDRLHARAAGDAVITASCEGVEASLALRVDEAVEPVAWIELVEGPTMTLAPGETTTLHVIAHAAGGEVLAGRPVAWSSSSPVATIDDTGALTAVARGRATITATVESHTAELGLAVVPELPAPTRSQAGGETGALVVDGDLAYVGVGPRLTIWDLAADPPVELGASAPLAGVIGALAVRDGRAYVAASGAPDDGTIYVVDVSAPATPLVGGATPLAPGSYARPSDLAIDGERLFVADRDQGLLVFSLADPDAPALVGRAQAFNATRVQPAGERVHVVGQQLSGMTVQSYRLDDLAPLGTLHLPNAMDAEVTPQGLVVSRGFHGLAVDDLADPSAPVRRFVDAGLSAWALVPGDGEAWLTVDGEVRRLELGDPIALAPAAGAVVWATTMGALDGDRLVFVDTQGGLTSLDVRGAPVVEARVPTSVCASCYATARWGDQIVVAATAPGGVGTLATAGGDALALLGQHQELSVDFEDVVLVDDQAYVADWFGGVWAFDLTDPAAPAPLARVETGGAPVAIARSGRRMYVGEDTSSGGALRVFEATPEGPVELGGITTDNFADLAVDGDLVYATFFAVLRIYDASDPTRIALLGEYTGCTATHGVAVAGALAVVGCVDGLHVIDVSDPGAPVGRSVVPYTSASGGRPVALDGTTAYLGHDRGVLVVDLADPDAPVVVDQHKTAWLVRHLAVLAPGRVAASTSRGGLYQWQR